MNGIFRVWREGRGGVAHVVWDEDVAKRVFIDDDKIQKMNLMNSESVFSDDLEEKMNKYQKIIITEAMRIAKETGQDWEDIFYNPKKYPFVKLYLGSIINCRTSLSKPDLEEIKFMKGYM